MEFTIKDQNGNPMTDLITKEEVSPASTVQNPDPVPRGDGKFTDLLGRGIFGPQMSSEEARKEAREARNNPNVIVQDHVVSIWPLNGRAAVATHQRIFSNVDDKGNLRPVVSTNGYSNNFTVRHTPIKVTPIPQRLICPRF